MSNKPEDWGTRKGCAFCGYHCGTKGPEPKFYNVQGIHYASAKQVPDIKTDFPNLSIRQNAIRWDENHYWKNKKWED